MCASVEQEGTVDVDRQRWNRLTRQGANTQLHFLTDFFTTVNFPRVKHRIDMENITLIIKTESGGERGTSPQSSSVELLVKV